MLAQVVIDENGAITVTVDTDGYEADDDASARLAGLTTDDLCDRAKKTALETWREIHGTSDGPAE